MTKFLKQKVKIFWEKIPCGTGGIKHKEASPEFFEEIENHRYKVEPFIHSFAQFTRWRGKKVLEVGAGAGTDFIQFARAGANLYGLDLTKKSVELIKKRLRVYNLKGNVQQGDVENLPFSSNQFDLVYSWGVLHHTPNSEKAVKEIYRVLKPGGSIKIMVYNKISWCALQSYVIHGLLGGKPFLSISKILAKHQESPGTKAYTVKEARNLFSLFRLLEVSSILTPYDRRWMVFPFSLLVNLIGDRFGWFMLIKGVKPSKL